MKLFIYILVIMVPLGLNAQYELSSEIGVGVGFNNELELNRESVSSDPSINLSMMINQDFYLTKKFYIDLGIGGIVYYSEGDHRFLQYSATVYRFLVNASFGYDIPKKWSFLSGVGFSTHRDAKYLDIHRHDNMRWDWWLKVRYSLSQKTNLTFRYRHSINDIGDSYFLGSPKHNLAIGVEYYLVNRDEKYGKKEFKN